jgi:dUTP pyrophosphatase
MVNIKLLNKSDNPTPVYKTKGAAGFDIASNEEVFLPPGAGLLLSTGIYLIIPEGYEGQLRLRSSMWKKTGIMPNAPGTIDSDYRGEIKIPIRNTHAHNSMHIWKGERVAQIVINKLPWVEMEEIDENTFNIPSNQTIRGGAGFGSTGNNE